MKKNYKSCMVGSLVTTAVLIMGSTAFAAHTDPIPLFDGDNNPVALSGGTEHSAYSAKNTCGKCHDYDQIENHSFHAQLGANQWTGWNAHKFGNLNAGNPKGKPWAQSLGHVGKW